MLCIQIPLLLPDLDVAIARNQTTPFQEASFSLCNEDLPEFLIQELVKIFRCLCKIEVEQLISMIKHLALVFKYKDPELLISDYVGKQLADRPLLFNGIESLVLKDGFVCCIL
jgi:hypothetical protein